MWRERGGVDDFDNLVKKAWQHTGQSAGGGRVCSRRKDHVCVSHRQQVVFILVPQLSHRCSSLEASCVGTGIPLEIRRFAGCVTKSGDGFGE